MHVFQTTSDHLYFFLKFGACYRMLQYKSVERIHSKEYCFMFSCTFLVFMLVFIIKLLFYHFIFFWRSIKFPPKNINQSETKVGDSRIDFYSFSVSGNLNFNISLYSHCFCLDDFTATLERTASSLNTYSEGFSEAYLVTFKCHGKIVALKVLPKMLDGVLNPASIYLLKYKNIGLKNHDKKLSD